LGTLVAQGNIQTDFFIATNQLLHKVQVNCAPFRLGGKNV